MQVNEHPIAQEELLAYLDGELAAERAAAAGEHLEGCADCQRLAGHLRSVSQRLTRWQVESQPKRITQGIAQRWSPRGRSKRSPIWPVVEALAAVLVLALAFVG